MNVASIRHWRSAFVIHHSAFIILKGNASMRLILFDCLTPQADQLLPAGPEPADLRAALRHDLAGREAGRQAGRERRGLLRAALHGRRLPGEDQPAGQRPRHAQGRRPAAGQRPGEGRRLRRRAHRPERGGRRRRRRGALRPDRQGRPGQTEDRLARRPARLGQGGRCPRPSEPPATWNYTWDLVLANPAQLAADFAAAGRSGIEGQGRGAQRHPRQQEGRVRRPRRGGPSDGRDRRRARARSISTKASRCIPSPASKGRATSARSRSCLGTKCREGNSIGPMCRVGGEVEESIIHGYSNKYHDGFLGHAYVGEWVNLGALTTNSDLKNDYSSVIGGPRRQDAHQHRLDQGRLADRRPHEDLDRHAVEHGRLRRRDGADRHHRQAAAEVHAVVRLVSSKARSPRVSARRSSTRRPRWP